MLDFVLWSFVIALTPWALGLALKLISDVGDSIRFRHSLPLQEAKQRSPLSALNLNPLSSSASIAARVPCSGARRFSAARRYGPL
jgi:hypothetical protein